MRFIAVLFCLEKSVSISFWVTGFSLVTIIIAAECVCLSVVFVG